MGGKKKEKKEEAEQEEASESGDSEMDRKMEEFDSDKSWEELDQMERELAEGIHEISSPEEMIMNPKKRDRKKQRQEEIEEYEEALKIAEKQNSKFINPYEGYKLNVNVQEYAKLLKGVIDEGKPHQTIARLMGIKSLKTLSNEAMFAQLGMLKKFLQNFQIPEWIKESHQFLLNSEGKVFCKASEPVSEGK